MTNTKTVSDMFYFHDCLSGVIKNAIVIKDEIEYII